MACAADRQENLASRGFVPYVVYTIVALCAASFGLQYLLGDARWTTQLMFVPVLGDIQPWRFLTAALVHAGILHIAMNMVALYAVGNFLEQSLGRVRFAALFVLSVLGGSVAVLVLSGGPTNVAWITPVVGASGGVFGLFAAVVFELRRLGGNAQSMLVIIGINLVFGFVFSGISWQGHVGGLVVGAVLGFIYTRLGRRTSASYLATAGVAVALVGLAAVTYARFGF